MSRAAGSLMLVGVLAAVLAFGVAPVGATHDADLTDAEVKCQLATANAFAKFLISVANCRIKCESAKLKGASVNCVGPDYDSATQECLNAARTAAATNGEIAKCVECPACYTGGNCTADAAARLESTETLLNFFSPFIYCASPSTAAELKCESGVAKNITKLIGSLGKCSQKCVSALHKGDISRVCSGTDDEIDDTTKTCQNAATAKAGAAIDKSCASKPVCWETAAALFKLLGVGDGSPLDGPGWVDSIAAFLSNKHCSKNLNVCTIESECRDEGETCGGRAYDGLYCGE